MKKMFYGLLIVFLTSSVGYAACGGSSPNLIAADASYTEVAACVSAATTGDTITVPAGTETWGSALVINKSIILKGNGIGSTVITQSSGKNIITISGAVAPTIRDFTFIGAGSIMISITSTSGGWRITNNKFQYSADFGTYAVFVFREGGLVDGNEFLNGRVQVNSGYYDSGWASWLSPLDLGGADATYVENNTFIGTSTVNYAGISAIDASTGGRTVFRYNDVRDMHIEQHSVQGDANRAARKWEVYNNAFVVSGDRLMSGYLISFRGGTGVIFNNTLTAATSWPVIGSVIGLSNVRSYEPRGVYALQCDGSSPWDGNEEGKYGYPCRDQIGRSTDSGSWVASDDPIPSQALDPAYMWNNTRNGATITSISVPIGTQKDYHILKDRDFYVSASTAKPDYAVYTCPHPLAGSGTCDPSIAGVGGYDVGESEPDTTPAVISGSLPSSQQACTSDPRDVTIQVSTNEAATCKYHASDTAYASMSNTFSTTGATTHSSVVNVACDASHTYYVRCSDSSDNVNLTSTVIQFQVADATDEAAPTLSTQVLSADGRTLTLTHNEAVKFGAGGNEGWDLNTNSAAEITLSYVSGANSTILIYYTNRPVLSTETLTLDYTQPTNGVEDMAGNDLANISAAAVTNSSTQSASSGENIWDEIATGSAATGNPVEIGLEFSISRSGLINGVRFYKDASNTGTHVGRLYSSTGTLLGEVTFADETESGWQEQSFANPIEVTDGTYIVTYHTAAVWNSIIGYFATPYTASPFTATQGRYRYGDGGIVPATTSTRNYLVDIAFTPGFKVVPSSTGGTTDLGTKVVASGTVEYALTPFDGWRSSISGNCGGSLDGNTYTTGEISADCAFTGFVEKKVLNWSR